MLYTENNSMDTNFISELTRIVGADGIRASNAEKHVYAFDAYTLEKQLPGVVVLPRSTEEVSAVARLCHASSISMVPRGAGTGLAGGATAKDDQVLISMARMNRILHVDVPNRRLRAQSGVVNVYLTRPSAHWAETSRTMRAGRTRSNMGSRSIIFSVSRWCSPTERSSRQAPKILAMT